VPPQYQPGRALEKLQQDRWACKRQHWVANVLLCFSWQHVGGHRRCALRKCSTYIASFSLCFRFCRTL
jgi:hypothetical protein